MKIFKYCRAVLIATVIAVPALLYSGNSRAEEKILAYHSDITLHPDATMLVIETIKVSAEGNRIKHGIYRDFPTEYEDRFGNKYEVGFNLLSVTKNGFSEPYHIQGLDNGIRIYAGDKNTYLRHGIYTYVISYTSWVFSGITMNCTGT